MELFYFALSVVTTMLLACPTKHTQAQGIPPPEVKVVPAYIRQSDSVNLTCETSLSPLSYCYFCTTLQNCDWKGSDSCRLALSGNDLIAWSGQSGMAKIELMCHYYFNKQASGYSPPTSVTIVGPPQLQVSPQLISETDTVHLICLTPQSPLVSQCFFLVGGKPLGNPMPSCQLQSTGKDLSHWAGVRPPAQMSLSCYYTVTTPQLSSDPSQPVSITVDSGRSWTTVIVIVAVIMFVGGLVASFLCMKTRRCAFKRPRVDDPHVSHGNLSMGSRSTTTAPGVMGDMAMASKDMAMPSTAAAASEMTVGLDPDYDSVYHVYSSIPDVPNSSNHEESPYSLIPEYTHLQSTQEENDIYSVVEID
ncbi:uncharacterized protein LOC121681579 isoform X1 [Alosa sapidissima]|uniref:uncharacterized protein LOC121681579 isoform X1 n=1 Tax=Alosa sapidissima TaxID=34773 RepID=UPI001C08AA56|nr:uncharacterized protein LOC121681579 isoform X1 [Alosa sapidissima]